MAMNDPAVKALDKWHHLLLKYMKGSLWIAILIFFGVSWWEMHAIRTYLYEDQTQSLSLLLETTSAEESKLFDNVQPDLARLRVLAVLEAAALDRRYRHAEAILGYGAFIRFLGFATGMVLTLIGSLFVLYRVDSDRTRVSGKLEKWEVFLDASPGVLLSILGSALMMATILKTMTVDVRDTAVYLGETQQVLSTKSNELPTFKPDFLDSMMEKSEK